MNPRQSEPPGRQESQSALSEVRLQRFETERGLELEGSVAEAQVIPLRLLIALAENDFEADLQSFLAQAIELKGDPHYRFVHFYIDPAGIPEADLRFLAVVHSLDRLHKKGIGFIHLGRPVNAEEIENYYRLEVEEVERKSNMTVVTVKKESAGSCAWTRAFVLTHAATVFIGKSEAFKEGSIDFDLLRRQPVPINLLRLLSQGMGSDDALTMEQFILFYQGRLPSSLLLPSLQAVSMESFHSTALYMLQALSAA